MLDLVSEEAARIESRFLEPACGSGNFLIPVLHRKLATVQLQYGRSAFERQHYALLALMSIYGIELLADNVAECRANLLRVLVDFLGAGASHEWESAGTTVLSVNIVWADALTMRTVEASEPITFAEWSYLGKGGFQRRDFRFDTLTQMSSFGEEDTLFADLGKHEIFTPIKSYRALSVADIARGKSE